MSIHTKEREVVVGGETYPNLYTAQVKLGVAEYEHSEIVKKSKQLGLNLSDTVLYLYNTKNGIEAKGLEELSTVAKDFQIVNRKDLYLEVLGNHFKQNFETFEDLRFYVGENVNPNLKETFIPFGAVDIAYHLVRGGLHTLILPTQEQKPFEFEGIFYRKEKEFLSHHGVIAFVFYAQVSLANGDINKALNIASEYIIPRGRLNYYGTKYDSYSHLVNSLGVYPVQILRFMTLELQYLEAVNLAKIMKDISTRGIEYKGRKYSLRELRSEVHLNLKSNLYTLLSNHIRGTGILLTRTEVISVLDQHEKSEVLSKEQARDSSLEQNGNEGGNTSDNS